MQAWLDRCKAAGVKPIAADDAVFTYCNQVGISAELAELCWLEFKSRQTASGCGAKDWREKFRKFVRENIYGLWFMSVGEPARLSSKGAQAQAYWAAQAGADASGEASS